MEAFPYSLLHAPEVRDLLRRWTQRPEGALILVRESLPAGERAGAVRAFVPHAATTAGAFSPLHIADTAVLYGAWPHGRQPIPSYTLGAIGEAPGTVLQGF
jgi:hypothetical protein